MIQMRQSSITKSLLSFCKEEMTFSVNLNVWKIFTKINMKIMPRSILLRTHVAKEEYVSYETITN